MHPIHNDYHDVMALNFHLLARQFLAFQLEAKMNNCESCARKTLAHWSMPRICILCAELFHFAAVLEYDVLLPSPFFKGVVGFGN